MVRPVHLAGAEPMRAKTCDDRHLDGFGEADSVTQLYVRAPSPAPTAGRSASRGAVGMLFLATCVTIGVLIGTVIAAGGSPAGRAAPRAQAHAAPIVTPIGPAAPTAAR